MTSDIKACSECGCSFEQNMIKEVLHQFPPVVTTLVVKFANFPSTYRVTHRGENPPHAVCPDCESFYLNLMCRMDADSFQCPHNGCQRIVYTG